jgi:hypothetical protein
MRGVAVALLLLSLGAGAASGQPARKEKARMVGQRPDEPPCKVRLRAALLEHLQQRDLPDPPGGWTVELIAARSAQLGAHKGPRYGIAGCVLRLPTPASGTALLTGLLRDENPLVALEAAAALAILGQRTGIQILRQPKGSTNSNIEAFYARAGLILLGEPIPPKLRAFRSVFIHLEQLIDACPP